MTEQRIYLDNAATTPPDSRVLERMRECDACSHANPSSLHREGCAARAILEESTAEMAHALNVRPHEVVWTSGGTESNMLAILGVIYAWRERNPAEVPHIVTTAIEHHSVLEVVRMLEEKGDVRVTYVPLGSDGLVRPETVACALRPTTALVSIHYAHNELGSMQPIRAIVRAVREALKVAPNPVMIHTDASQAPAWISCQPHALGVDLMTLDGHKMYGPKGIGCLYRRYGVELRTPYGSSEQVRPGTPPVALIAGCARACALVTREREEYAPRISTLRDACIAAVSSGVRSAVLNGPTREKCLANTIHFSFPGLSGERLVLALDAVGVAASSRSACLRNETEGSVVLRALGADAAHAVGTLRLTLSRYTTSGDMERATKLLIDTVLRLYADVSSGQIDAL
ncbi:MAG: cysteine desulfurase [Candidatus Pacebacteria bacterium]|nr:cysteine desulfurase [Candidatus Paceibacterota bacterium]